MKRVILFRNGAQVDGKVVLVTHSIEELLETASFKFGYTVKKVFTPHGGEIDDIKLLRNDDVLYVAGDEPFIPVDRDNENVAPGIVLADDLLAGRYQRMVPRTQTGPLKYLSSCYTLIPGKKDKGEVDEGEFVTDDEAYKNSLISSFSGVTAVAPPESLLNSATPTESGINALSLKEKVDDPQKKRIGGKLQNWVTLNVGGKLFTTTRSTLVSKEPASMLARMFAEDSEYSLTPSDKDERGAYLIDRSPTYFEPILNYLRSGQLIYDTNVNPAGILQEARFFGIESLVQHIENVITRPCDVMPLSRRNVIKALITTPYKSELRFQGVNLAGSDLSRLDLRYINFKFACLHGCRMVGTNLSFCSLERADLSHAVMESAQLIGAKMLCANMEGANLRNCNFEDPTGNRTNMEGVNLKGANLECSNMAGVNLRVATLKNANLKNCDLRAAVLAGADLEKCDLSGSDLHEANLRGANLKDAAFELMLTPLHMSQTIR